MRNMVDRDQYYTTIQWKYDDGRRGKRNLKGS